MPTTQPTFWTRITGSLRRQPHSDGQRPHAPVVSEDMASTASPEAPEPAAEIADRAGPLARWSRRDQAIVQLQEGYEKVTRVIEDIQQHLVQQGERSERLCGAIEQIARTMAEGPQIARQQAKTLEQIAGQLETANARTQQLAAAVGEIPQAARAQTETLTGISRQLEASNEQRVVTSQTMDRLGNSLRSLGQNTEAQGEILQRMHSQNAEQGQHIVQLIAQQSKRFQWLFIVTILMAVAAIGAAIIGLTTSRL